MSFAGFRRYPFLRILLPFGIGVFCGDELFFQGYGEWLSNCLFPVLFLLIVFLIEAYFRKSYLYRWRFGVALWLFLFFFGMGWMNHYLQHTIYPFSEKETIYRVMVQQKPEKKEHTFLCKVLLSEQRDSTRTVPINHRALLYLSSDTLSALLNTGDILLVYTRFSLPVKNGNPDEFDYSRFLTRKQISATGFAYSSRWKRIGHTENHSLRQQSAGYRNQLLELYHRLGFEGDQLAVLSALTIGYKENLSEEIQESYSVSGASHVLALSGLHIGFLYVLLYWGLKLLVGRWARIEPFRVLLIVLTLWAFAFFTGLSPSVVRSVVMFSLFACATLFRRTPHSLNTLSAAAFVMLLGCPGWLFDVGFQLSFIAVAAILFIQPRLFQLVRVKNRFQKYVWGLLTVSIAAQIGTAPLVVLYFSRFSNHFLLTNLLVIPLVSIIMYVAIIMLLLTPVLTLQLFVARMTGALIEALNGCVRWVEQLPGSSLDGVWVNQQEVFLFYLILLGMMRYWTFHSRRWLIGSLFGVFILCTYHLVLRINNLPQSSLVFYNVHNCPVVHCIARNGNSWLIYADSVPNAERLHQVVSRNWNRLGLKKPISITPECKKHTDIRGVFCFQEGIFSFLGARVGVVNNDYWLNKTVLHPLPLDYLYLCNGYRGRLKPLLKLFATRCVVFDSSLPEYRRRAYENECRELGLYFMSLSEKGSVRFLL